MRTPIVLAAMFLLTTTLVPALAAAHTAHDTCQSKTTPIDGILLHVDVYNQGCAGVFAYVPAAYCGNGIDDHRFIDGVHVLVLYGGHCGEGVAIELP